jgi:hypothetical protein
MHVPEGVSTTEHSKHVLLCSEEGKRISLPKMEGK